MEEDQQRTDLLVFSREDTNTDPVVLTSYQDMTEVHLYGHDNTLVVLERRAVENMITSVITIDNFKLSLWNSETLGEIFLVIKFYNLTFSNICWFRTCD